MSIGVSNAIFALVLIGASVLFYRNLSRIRRNILLGRDLYRTDNKPERWEDDGESCIGSE